MKNAKRFVVVGIAVLVLLVGTVAAFAASQYATPAEAVAGLTGRDLQSVIDERVQTGKTYGSMATEAGVLEQFRAEMREMKKDIVEARVAAGKMTREQADAIIAKITANQAVCDGSGTGCGDGPLGAGFGNGSGLGQCKEQCGVPGGHGYGLKGRGHGQAGDGLGQGGQEHRHGGRGQGSQNDQGLGQGGHGQGMHQHLRDGSCMK